MGKVIRSTDVPVDQEKFRKGWDMINWLDAARPDKLKSFGAILTDITCAEEASEEDDAFVYAWYITALPSFLSERAIRKHHPELYKYYKKYNIPLHAFHEEKLNGNNK